MLFIKRYLKLNDLNCWNGKEWERYRKIVNKKKVVVIMLLLESKLNLK